MNRNQKPDSLLAWLDLTPPFWVYYLSHEGKRGPKKRGHDPKKRFTYQQMAERGGLSPRTFLRLTSRLSWRDVTAAAIDGFCRGCDVDLLHFSRQRNYLAIAVRDGHAYHYLSAVQARRFRELCLRWKASKATI